MNTLINLRTSLESDMEGENQSFHLEIFRVSTENSVQREGEGERKRERGNSNGGMKGRI